MSRAALWRFLAIALPTLAALIAPLPTVDLAFQLRAGNEILTQHAIPAVDAWTFTVANTPWVDQQWAAQVLLQLVDGLAGWTGLVVLRAVLVAVAYGLLLLVVRRRAPALPPAVAAILVIAAFAISAEALALRPQLFAIDLFAATLLILSVRDRRPRLVWLIPLLALAWANLHGTFLFAPALCGLAWIADLYDGAISTRRSSPHRMLLVGLVSLAATLVNPFGLGAWTYVANLTSNPAIAGRVSEWQPPNPLTPSGAIVWLSVLAVAALAAVRVREALAEPGARGTTEHGGSTGGSSKRRGTAFRSRAAIPWPALLTLALFGGFALVSGRGQAWWPFVALFVVAPWVARRLAEPASAGERPIPGRPTPVLLRRLNAAIAIALVIVGVALLPSWRPTGQVGVPNGTLIYAPQGIAAFLVRLTATGTPACSARIWNPQPWGSWLELEAPCARYAVDSRIELYPPTVWDDAAVVDAGALGWNSVLAAEGATVVVTDRATEPSLESSLETSVGWTRLYADCDGSVWVLGGGRASPGALPPVGTPSCP